MPTGCASISLPYASTTSRAIGAEERVRDDVGKVVVGVRKLDAKRMAVDRFEVRELRVVVELARLLRLRGEGVEPFDLAIQQERVRRAVRRIGEAHERVHEILRDKLARRALERGVGREVDALAKAERVGTAAVGDLGHRLRHHGHELGRPREVVVGKKPLENGLQHRRGVVVRDAYRVEAGLGSLEREPDDLAGIRLGQRRGGTDREQEDGGYAADHVTGPRKTAAHTIDSTTETILLLPEKQILLF